MCEILAIMACCTFGAIARRNPAKQAADINRYFMDIAIIESSNTHATQDRLDGCMHNSILRYF